MIMILLFDPINTQLSQDSLMLLFDITSDEKRSVQRHWLISDSGKTSKIPQYCISELSLLSNHTHLDYSMCSLLITNVINQGNISSHWDSPGTLWNPPWEIRLPLWKPSHKAICCVLQSTFCYVIDYCMCISFCCMLVRYCFVLPVSLCFWRFHCPQMI